MPPEMFVGMLMGAAITLAIQWYGNRRVRKATNAPDLQARRGVERIEAQDEARGAELIRLQQRLAVLEQIAVDPAHRTAREIDALRHAG